jgi:hypothetical protein
LIHDSPKGGRKQTVELLSVARARSIWLFDPNDLNPRGRSVATELQGFLKNTYSFSKVPSSPSDLDETKALAFLGGRYPVTPGNFVDIDLKLYNDGFVADTRSSTRDTDAFIDDALKLAAKELGLNYRPEIIKKRIYLSELNLKSDRVSLDEQTVKLKAFADTLSSLFGGQVELSGIGFWTDHTSPPGFSSFRFERKLNTAFSENRYYSLASLQTEDHLRLLDQFEALLTN